MIGLGIKQRSKEWYSKRIKMITASDVAAILGYNKYSSKFDILDKKINPKEFTSAAIELGIKYEPLAIKEYETLTNTKIKEVGLYEHPIYEWLGASPDGYIEDLNRLLEIKCVSSRSIKTFPYMYWIQMQIQMEVCDKEECDFFQCKFKDDELVDWSLQLIKRDKDWFETIKPKLEIFHNDLLYSLKKGRIQRKRKRFNSYIDFNADYQNIQSITNYMNDDPSLDYYNLYVDKSKKDKTTAYNEYILKSLTRYKNNIFEKIPLSVDVCSNEKYKSYELFQETMEHIKNGVPVIKCPLFLHNGKYFIGDMIIRNDYLDILTNYQTGASNKKYSLVMIKFRTLKLDNDYNIKRETLSAELIGTAYQQLNILNQIQEINSNIVYVIGRRYKKDNNIFKKGMLGVINFSNDFDKISKKSDRALSWLDEVKQLGKYWDVYNPERWEMYPNMKNKKDYGWRSYKKTLALANQELTLIRNIGIKKRKELHHLGIFKWKKIRKGFVDDNIYNIIKINKLNRKNIFNIPEVFPFDKTIKKFFVDFETVNDLSVPGESNYNNSIIYIIGCGHLNEVSNEWEFKTFKARSFNSGSEKKIILDWYKYMNNFKVKYEVLHWTNAEKTFLNKAIERSRIRNISGIVFRDLYKVFINNNIVVKGAFSYKLKDIAGALETNGYIETKWEDDMDGLHASLYGWLELTEGNREQLKSIIYYNEIDCKVLFDIYNLLLDYSTTSVR